MKPELTFSRGLLRRSSIWLAAMIWVARAAAATITWNNPAGGEWGTAANWSPSLVPGTGDTAVFEGTAGYAVVVAGNRSVGTLVVDNPNAVLRLVGRQGTGNATLTVANGFENLGVIELTSQFSSWSATLNVTAGALTNGVSGVLRVLEGSAGNRTLGLELDNRGTLEIERSLNLTKSGAKHRNSGTISIAESTSLTVGGGGAIELTHAGGAWTGTGALNLPTGRPFILESDFELGTVVVDWQSVTIEGPGTFRVPSGRTLIMWATTVNAPFDLQGDLEVWGNCNLNTPLAVRSGSTMRLLGRQGGGNSVLNVPNGFENLGVIELTSDFSSWSTTLNVTAGALTNAAGGTIRVLEGSAGTRTLGLELDNRGTLEVERSVNLTKPGAKHRNSGTISIAENTSLTVGGGGSIDVTHAGGNWRGTGALNLPAGRPFILESDFELGTVVVEWQSVTIEGPGTFRVPSDRALILWATTVNAPLDLQGDLEVWGNCNLNTPLVVRSGSMVRLLGRQGGGNSVLNVPNGFENLGVIELTSDFSSWSTTLNVTAGALTNAAGGTIRVLEGSAGTRTLGLELDNRGTLAVERNVTLNQASAKHRNVGLIEVAVGELTLQQSGSAPSFANQGEVRVLAGATFRPTGGALINEAGGVFSGAGTFNLTAGTFTNEGKVAPGLSAGTLNVTGNYPQGSDGTLELEIGGFTSGTEHDVLAVSGAANLNGTLRTALIEEFAPRKDDTFIVLTYGSRTGEFSAVESTEPERIAWRVDYAASGALLIVANTAPTLEPIADQKVDEGAPLSVNAVASDADLPAQALSYELAQSPVGMTIDATTGQLTWTPGEEQGPGSYPVIVRVSDDGNPTLSRNTGFQVTVNEVNTAPELVLPGPQTVDEQVELGFTINATDVDLPANALTLEMFNGPEGATFNPTTREFRWIPAESQGPGTFTASFRVNDNNPDALQAQSLSATGEVAITVNEVNTAPMLPVVADATVHAGESFHLVLTGTDADMPANVLGYALATGPAGAVVDAVSGELTWEVPAEAADTTVNFTVRVTDDGVPALSTERSFQLIVVGPVEIVMLERSDGTLRVIWRAIPSRNYRLLRSHAFPADDWTATGGDVTATDVTAEQTVGMEDAAGATYLRVQLVEE